MVEHNRLNLITHSPLSRLCSVAFCKVLYLVLYHFQSSWTTSATIFPTSNIPHFSQTTWNFKLFWILIKVFPTRITLFNHPIIIIKIIIFLLTQCCLKSTKPWTENSLVGNPINPKNWKPSINNIYPICHEHLCNPCNLDFFLKFSVRIAEP